LLYNDVGGDMELKIGETYRVKYPFIMAEHTTVDTDGQPVCTECWRPGTKERFVPPDDTEAIADDEGAMLLTIVDIHKPGRYPERVFYTRKWEDPDGGVFGATKLHITTTPAFKRRATAFYYPYKVV